MRVRHELVSTKSLVFACLLTTSCTASTANDLKVTGSSVTSDYPAVVQIKNGRGACTATFVSANMLLTAAHCVVTGQVSYGKQTSQDITVHPDYVARGGISPEDLAVVKFTSEVAPDTVKLRAETPQAGETLTIVGYGNNDNASKSGAGVKRVGSNKVSKVSNGYINFQGTMYANSQSENDSLSGSGDSGGPLFIDDQLAGVTSGGGGNNSYYVDLNSESSRSFLSSVGLKPEKSDSSSKKDTNTTKTKDSENSSTNDKTSTAKAKNTASDSPSKSTSKEASGSAATGCITTNGSTAKDGSIWTTDATGAKHRCSNGQWESAN